MILEIEINGARVRVSGDNLSVIVADVATGEVKSGFRPEHMDGRYGRASIRKVFDEVTGAVREAAE